MNREEAIKRACEIWDKVSFANESDDPVLLIADALQEAAQPRVVDEVELRQVVVAALQAPMDTGRLNTFGEAGMLGANAAICLNAGVQIRDLLPSKADMEKARWQWSLGVLQGGSYEGGWDACFHWLTSWLLGSKEKADG